MCRGWPLDEASPDGAAAPVLLAAMHESAVHWYRQKSCKRTRSISWMTPEASTEHASSRATHRGGPNRQPPATEGRRYADRTRRALSRHG